MEMLVVRTDGPIVTVRDPEGHERRCVLRGRLRKEMQGTTSPVVVGDRVEVEPLGEGEGAIARVLPRRSRLARRAPSGHDRGHAKEHVLAANVDVAVIVVAAPPRPTVIDRYLALVAAGGCAPLVCVNKIDLADRARLADTVAPYSPVVLTSALTAEGIPALRDALRGRLAAFIGPSGAGKSSLLNALDPGLDLRVGPLSVAGKGSHTTTWAALYRVGDALVVDTPGLREITFVEDALPEGDLFPEVSALAAGCRFRDCTHTHEPRCAVKTALEAGDLDEDTYRRYVRLVLRDDPNAQARLKALSKVIRQLPKR